MFMPSARSWEEMKYEAAGCWPLPINKGDEFALVTKVPASSIKAAYRSCPVSLTVAQPASFWPRLSQSRTIRAPHLCSPERVGIRKSSLRLRVFCAPAGLSWFSSMN